ncbi:MAG: hypothetical protein WCW52_03325 [Elusimicrobiales bacterium]|jgi:phenylacetate-coenzyme A ligase PaaK-like adenylate-forming protein
MARRLADYVRYAARLPFYKRRLAAFSPGAQYPLAGTPVLEAKDLRRLLPPRSEELIADKSCGRNIFQSGGTTGCPKTTIFSHKELEGLYLPNARGFHAVGLDRSDRVANLFAVGGLYMTFIHIHRMLQEFGCSNFPFSNHTPSEFVHPVCRLFKINCFAGIASVVLNTLRDMEKMGLRGIRIEKIYYGGEHLYEADKAELREKFGAKLIAAPGYGTVDSWYIGYQCVRCPTGVFHAHDDQVYIELVDEETGRHCAPGETGMMYVTAFPRLLTPIVRYRVGDLARWLPGPCSCGRTTPLFELRGRGDDVLRIGFDSVDYGFIQKMIGRVKGLLGSAQMEKRRENGRDRLILRVETPAPKSARAVMRKVLEREILKERPTLNKAVSTGAVLPPEIELLAPGAIPRNPRTGKLVRVLDVLR